MRKRDVFVVLKDEGSLGAFFILDLDIARLWRACISHDYSQRLLSLCRNLF